MQNGPFGITSRATIFMAAYKTILSLHLEFESLDNVETIPNPLLEVITSKSINFNTKVISILNIFFLDLSDSLKELKQDWLHPLLWELLRGDLGLYSKVRFFLKRHGRTIVFDKMFLLAPDSRHLNNNQ